MGFSFKNVGCPEDILKHRQSLIDFCWVNAGFAKGVAHSVREILPNTDLFLKKSSAPLLFGARVVSFSLEKRQSPSHNFFLKYCRSSFEFSRNI